MASLARRQVLFVEASSATMISMSLGDTSVSPASPSACLDNSLAKG